MNKVRVIKELITIAKMDSSAQVIKGVVYEPLVLDSQEDWMAPEEIKKSAHNFMKNLNLQNVDTSHDLSEVDAYVCESYIAKADDPEGFVEGAWVVAIKVESDDIWSLIESGEIGGLSMYGPGMAYEGVEPPIE